ncbi:MAG TPA: histidine ammonia-lyase [Chitinophagaceae bacterium]|nr:histidine ammonia-lyase [Chitinophagaceae bacterium]
MHILPEEIKIEDLQELLQSKIQLSEEQILAVKRNREYLDKKVKSGQTFYGINTGFGSLCNVRVSEEELSQLQENLVKSHACGMGNPVPKELVKLMILLKIKGLSRGYSGIHPDTINRLVYFYNEDILPVVYEQGSLGASGDLAPLAHLSLPLLGLGEVWEGEKIVSAEKVLDKHGLKPLKLQSKEGLALLNGTQFMSAYAAYLLWKSGRLFEDALKIAALSTEAFDAKKEPYLPYIHAIRPHNGQKWAAKNMLQYLEGSQLQEKEKEQVQDPYSFRCIPQVHGASKDAWEHVKQIVETEINSVTDNPIVFEEEDLIVSGGNFHGQPLALTLDYLAIAMAEIGNISERRTYLLISGTRGLPDFLSPNPGLNSGFMIAQYTAASIVSQSKQYCTPASVDSIVSSNGQEDHVSMGANAATKAYKVLKNLQRILAIELLCASQAMDFRDIDKTSLFVKELQSDFRKVVTFNKEDRFLHEDMIKAEEFLNNGIR